jgi:hypothetical protein
MSRYPSVKTLLELTDGDRKLALAVRRILDGRTPRDRPRESRLTMIDELIDGSCGVEHLTYECSRYDSDYGYEILGFDYLNTGDTYSVTLVRDFKEGRFLVTTYGDMVEKHEKRCSDCKRIRREQSREEKRREKKWERENLCHDPTHPHCVECREMARECRTFTVEQLRLKEEGKVA